METKRLRLILFYLLLVGVSNGWSQGSTMTLKQSDGSDRVLSLIEIGKIIFFDSNMMVYNKSGNSTAYSIASIENVTFNTASTGIDDATATSKRLEVYPNPVSNALYLHTDEPNEQMTIYRIDGVAVMVFTYTGTNARIDVSHLPKGFYFIKSSKYTAKFHKL